eukprot:997363-Karenia_brevis.AAC.1
MPAHRLLTPKAPVQKRLLAAMTIPSTSQISTYSFCFVFFIGLNDTVLGSEESHSSQIHGQISFPQG